MPIVTTSSRKRPRRGAPGKHAQPVPAVAILVIAALVAYFLLRNPAPSEPRDSGTPPSRSASTGPRIPPVENLAPYEPRDGGTPSPQPVPVTLPNSDRRDAAAVPSAAPTNATETAASAEALTPGRRLRHGSEQLLAMIISTDETGVPPLPISPEDEESLRRDLLAAITNDIVIFDDEDAKTQDVKERVADAKRQLADILQKGGSVVEAIREYEAHVNEGAKLRSEVIAKIAPEVDAIEDDAKALEYVESVNEALKKEDIPPIKPEEVGFEKTENE